MKLSSRILAPAVLSMLAISAAATAAPTQYQIDTVHSRVTFYVNHLGFSNSVGEFHLADAALKFDAADWAKSAVDVQLPVETLDLGDAKWQTHILSKDFLEAEKYPAIRFVSTAVTQGRDGKGTLSGELTLHGVTKPVVLELKLNKAGEHPMRKTQAVGFTATTVIHRSEFGVAAYVPAVADDIEVRIEIEAFAPAAP